MINLSTTLKYNILEASNQCAKFNSIIFVCSMEHKFTFTKSYRYELINVRPEPQIALYVLHGYGQLAKFFIRKFQGLPSNIMIVAPEGMHRFYLKGSSGRVGASWMTKEARESDIADTTSWLNEMDRQISEKHSITKRILLGFSQGGATAARWERDGNVTFDLMLLWACVFPPDIEQIIKPSKVNRSYFIIGSEDEYYDEITQQKLIENYEKMNFDITRYSGTHNIDMNTLTEILFKNKLILSK